MASSVGGIRNGNLTLSRGIKQTASLKKSDWELLAAAVVDPPVAPGVLAMMA